MTPKLMRVVLLIAITLLIAQTKLTYMSTVFRHGARYPVNNMYDGKETLTMHGNLTSIGLREHYLLGNYLKNQYLQNSNILLINSTLKTRELEVFTMTDQTRCVESAYAHVQGLFPLLEGDKVDPNIDPELLDPPFETIFPTNLVSEQAPTDYALDFGFQPVPIRYGDVFFPKCHNEAQIFIKRGEVTAKIISEFQIQYSLFTQQMTKLFNIPLVESNLAGLVALYDTLACDNYVGRKMPAQLTDRDYQTLMFIHRYMFALVFEDIPSRIFNAPYINTMLNNMEKVIQKKLDVKKLSIYSGHDTNLVPLLVFYNLTSAECLNKQWMEQRVTGNCAVPIPFASNLFFELHQDDKNSTQYFVKMRYNGKYFNLCGKNTTQCPFEEFAQKSRSYLLDFAKQCGYKQGEDYVENEKHMGFAKILQIIQNQAQKEKTPIFRKNLFKLTKAIQQLASQQFIPQSTSH